MNKRKREKRKIIFIITAVSIIAVIFGVLMNNRYAMSSLGDIKPISGKYKKVYYLQTEYKNAKFRTVFDEQSASNEDFHDVRIAVMNYEGEVDGSITDGSVPPNNVIEATLSPDEYKFLIDGYDLFNADLTVTTVLIPVDNFVYMYTYLEPIDPKKLARRSANNLNSHIDGNSQDGVLMEMPRSELNDYVKKYKFKEL